MGYHSGLNGEYSSNIPVKVNSKYVKHFQRCCKEEVPEKAIKVETYLKDDTIYFVLPSNYKPVKIVFDSNEEDKCYAYGGKGNKRLNTNIDFTSSDPRTTGYHQNDDYVNISDSTNYAQSNNIYENSNTYVSIFDSLLDLNNQLNSMGCSAEEAGDALSSIFDKLYNK